MRLVFLHGLEGSPTGHKVQVLRRAGFDVTAPELDTRELVHARNTHGDGIQAHAFVALPLAAAAEAVKAISPDVLVGSSFGGGLAVELMHRGLWSGPTVLLAPAAKRMFGHQCLPATKARTVILHGRADEIVPVADSVELATKSPGEVQLCLVSDEHRLTASVDAGLLERLVCFAGS